MEEKDIGWINRPSSRKIILNAVIMFASFTIAILYVFVETDYSFDDLLSYSTLINTVVINSVSFLLMYAINDLVITNFRSKSKYINIMTNISDKKKRIETNRITKHIYEFLNSINLNRKRKSKIKQYDMRLEELGNKEKDAITKEATDDIRTKIKEIDNLKEKVQNEDDLYKINVEYKPLTRPELLSGVSVIDKDDIDLTDKAKSELFKKTMLSKIIIFVIVTLSNGIIYDFLKNGDYFMMAMFITVLLFTIVSTISNTIYIEENVTMMKASMRNSYLSEFLEKYDNTETKKEDTN